MTLRERIEKTPARTSVLALGGCFTLSSISLLSEGFDHLRFFIPGAVLNLVVGAFASERIARAFLVIEAFAVFVFLGSTFLRLYERHLV